MSNKNYKDAAKYHRAIVRAMAKHGNIRSVRQQYSHIPQDSWGGPMMETTVQFMMTPEEMDIITKEADLALLVDPIPPVILEPEAPLEPEIDEPIIDEVEDML